MTLKTRLPITWDWAGAAGEKGGCGHRLASLALERPPGGARSRAAWRAWAGKARGQRVPGRRGCGLGVSSRNQELGPLPSPPGVSQRVRTLGGPDGQRHRLSSGSRLVLRVKNCVPRLCGWTLEKGRGAHTRARAHTHTHTQPYAPGLGSQAPTAGGRREGCPRGRVPE